MAMAYWGEAMTYNHSLWRSQEFDDGFAAIENAKIIEKTTHLNAIEKGLLHAAEILYEPKTSKKDRDKNYMTYMEKLYSKYPNNHEIAAFYSLSLLTFEDLSKTFRQWRPFEELPETIRRPWRYGAWRAVVYNQ